MKPSPYHLAWIAPSALLAFLWMRAGMDTRYLLRVIVHRDSSTSDYLWKRSMRVARSESPSPWPALDDCPSVAQAFSSEPGGTDMDSYLSTGGALALVVLRQQSACEWYGNGGARDRPAAAFSISKTVTSLLLARAVAEQRIPSLDQAIAGHAPALVARDPRFADITLAQLVDMRSGIAFDEQTAFPWVDQDAPAVYYASDLARTIVTRPRIAAAPGTFLYNDYAPNLIGLALEQAYGARLAPGPMQALWSALGAEYPAAWSVDDRGFAWHESGLVITARDLARIGRLMLSSGRVGQRQVAPLAFLTRSFDPLGRQTVVTFADTPLGYRNGWWVLSDGALLAMGRHGQIMLISPATGTVIVRLGLDGHAETNVAIARRLQRVAHQLPR